jgi:hypothetical protein
VASGRFEKGRSGNPSGRRPGTRCRATLAAEALLQGEAKALTRKAIEVALTGDVQALRLCLDRIAPIRRGSTVRLDLPEITSTTDITAALSAVLAAVADGTLTADEAAGLTTLIEAARRSLETEQLERRIAAVEARQHAS